VDQAELERYIFRAERLKAETRHPEITAPILRFRNQVEVVSHSFMLSWEAITEPFVMEPQPMVHDFDQVLMFIGGDPTNLPELGGEVRISLGKEQDAMSEFVLTTATVVYIPAGLWHCPLVFARVDDPKRPILFQDLVLTKEYKRSYGNQA